MDLKDIGKPMIIRTENAGVFAGTIISKNGNEVSLINARRLWYWEGAASLSELAIKGVATPNKCKFPKAVPKITLLQVIEIIPATDEAMKSIEAVKIWTAH